MAYDLLEDAGATSASGRCPSGARRLEALADAVAHPALLLSPRLALDSWDALADERRTSRAGASRG